MKMSEEFPSKYLKAADLQGREVRVTMAHVEREKIGDDAKPVLYFKGKDKGVVLNKTNAGTISDAYGDDTEDWFDQPLILFSVMVDFQGKVAPAIRCRVPTAKDNRQVAPQREDPISSGPIPQRKTGGVSDNMQMTDDEIPF
jgi:arabinogalactan endo-1,4-beta-galactosidase